MQDKPKEILPVVDLNVTLNSNTGHPHGMQMVAGVKGKTRSYFVYSENPQVRTRFLERLSKSSAQAVLD